MGNIPRNHHYIPQFYLRGFSDSTSKKASLIVYDFEEKRIFKANPKNIGSKRDFNFIVHENQPPGKIESEFSNIENVIANALNELKKGHDFSGDTKDSILYFVALLLIRSPRNRELWSQSSVVFH